jgi:dTDP-4-amino-4,6-dideoxygalactose transaminase
MKALQAENIDCGVHYPTPLNKQPIIEELLKPVSCPISEDLSKMILSLPMHPYLSYSELESIIDGVKKVNDNYLR